MKLEHYKFERFQELHKSLEDKKTFAVEAVKLLKQLGYKGFLEIEGEQILAHISRYKLSFDAVEFLNTNLTNDWEIGLYKLLSLVPRGDLLSSGQTKVPQYCALVPLYLAAFKKYRDVPYSSWKDSDISLLAPQLDSAMRTDTDHPSRSTTQQERAEALSVALKGRSAQTTYSIYPLPPFNTLHILAKAMVLQSWCAHPANRNKYMILDPWDWDAMPEPIVAFSESRLINALPNAEILL